MIDLDNDACAESNVIINKELKKECNLWLESGKQNQTNANSSINNLHSNSDK